MVLRKGANVLKICRSSLYDITAMECDASHKVVSNGAKHVKNGTGWHAAEIPKVWHEEQSELLLSAHITIASLKRRSSDVVLC